MLVSHVFSVRSAYPRREHRKEREMTVLWVAESFLSLFCRFLLVCHLPRTSYRFGALLVGSWVQIASEKVRHQCVNEIKLSVRLLCVIIRFEQT